MLLYNFREAWIGSTPIQDGADLEDRYWFNGDPVAGSHWCIGEPQAATNPSSSISYCIVINYKDICLRNVDCDTALAAVGTNQPLVVCQVGRYFHFKSLYPRISFTSRGL